MQDKNEVQVTINSFQKDHTKEKKSKLRKANKGNRVRLICMLILTFGYFLVEIVVGYMTGSVALVADSFHMLSDVISLVIAFIAVRMSPKKWNQNTFGWARAEVLGALVNAVFLVALCFTIVAESLERFINIKDIEDPKLILVVGSVGLGVNLIGLVLFHEHGHSHGGGGGGHGHSHDKKSHHSHKQHTSNLPDSTLEHEHKTEPVDLVNWTSLPPSDISNPSKCSSENPGTQLGEIPKSSSATQMNMHGVFLHVLADALGSVIVIVSSLVIWLTEWEYRMYVDPLLSLLMVILIVCSVWPLFVESSMVLLQTVPTHIQIDELKNKLLSKVRGAHEVHEFHIWQLSGNRIIASAHILCNSQADFMRIGEEVKEFFHNEGIHSTTIQLEFANSHNGSQVVSGDSGSDSDIQGDCDSDTRSDCFLTCPFDDEDAECVNNSCCRVQKRKNIVVSTASSNACENNVALPISFNSNLGYVESDDESVSTRSPNVKSD